jgi:hypothetical protein
MVKEQSKLDYSITFIHLLDRDDVFNWWMKEHEFDFKLKILDELEKVFNLYEQYELNIKVLNKRKKLFSLLEKSF